MNCRELNNRRLRKASRVVIPLFCWLAAAMALAQEAGEAGEEREAAARHTMLYLEPAVPFSPGSDLEAPPEISRSPALDPEFQQRMRSIQRFNEAIADAEILAGAWDIGMVEQLDSLGSLQHQQGDYLGAIETHERAIHVQRVNSGLHTIDQTPLVAQMIDSYAAMGNWAQVDVYQNYLFYIQQKFYGNNDPRLIPALGELADWHARAFALRQGDSLAMRLSSAQMLFKAAARMVEVHFGRDDDRYLEYLRGVARTAHVVALNQDLLRELARAQFRAPQETLRDMLYWHYPIVPSGFRAGEDALLAIREYWLEREAEAEAGQLAEATAQVADWYLLFNRRGAARDMYMRAWEEVAGQEDAGELRRRLFGQVREIPVFAFDDNEWMIENIASLEDVGEVDYGYVELRFDVTQWGEARNLETIGEQSPETESQHGWVRRKVRDSMFRPMLVDGELARSNGNLFRYRYWY